MPTQEFLDKYHGQPIDYDHAYGPQCVDLYDQYCQEALGVPVILVNGAVNIWDNYPTDYFDKIPNTADNFPQLGDVVIWGLGIGPFGHIAISRDGDKNSFTSLDQNWNGVSHCEYITHSYITVLGWLRPKSTTPVPQPTPLPIQSNESSQTGVVPSSAQTKIPIGVDSHGYDWGEMELQAVRSNLGDMKYKLDSLLIRPDTPTVPETPPTSPIQPPVVVVPPTPFFSQLLAFVGTFFKR